MGKSDRYRILVNGDRTHDDLTTDEFFDRIQDMADDFYANNGPSAEEVTIQYKGRGPEYRSPVGIGSTFPQRPSNNSHVQIETEGD